MRNFAKLTWGMVAQVAEEEINKGNPNASVTESSVAKSIVDGEKIKDARNSPEIDTKTALNAVTADNHTTAGTTV